MKIFASVFNKSATYMFMCTHKYLCKHTRAHFLLHIQGNLKTETNSEKTFNLMNFLLHLAVNLSHCVTLSSEKMFGQGPK